MKYLRLFEDFEDIDSICKKYGITNYTINSDGSIDVSGNVRLCEMELKKLPVKFGKVTGNFNCRDNQLKSLEGAPKEVGRDFSCHNNKLTSLEGAPKEVGRDFFCSCNELTSLDGTPNELNGDFYCDNNPIYQVYKLFGSHKEYIDSLDFNYLRGINIVKSRFEEALEETGKELPEKIEGYNYI